MSLRSLLDVRRTLAFRLTFRLTGIFAGCTVVLFALCYAALSHIERGKIDDELAEDAAEIAVALDRKGIDGAIEGIENEARSEGIERAYFELLGADGSLIGKTDAGAWAGLAAAADRRAAFAPGEILATAAIPGTGDRARLHLASFPSGHQLVSAYRLNDLEYLLNRAGAFFLLTAAGMTCLAAFVGWRITRRAMAGVEEVTQTARTIAQGRLDARVSISGWGTEIERLAVTFNEMLGRIERLMEELTEMGDNIAHDLRTPIMRIRASAESLIKPEAGGEDAEAAAAAIMEECERLLSFIVALLDISEAESGIAAKNMAAMDLAALARDMVEVYQPAAEDKGLSLSIADRGPVPFIGERDKLQRLLANLLDNAIKYTPPGGVVTVDAAARGSRVEIEVRDNGVGIPAKSLPHVFERYYRADSSRSVPGNGLGLSYVQALARAWGGEATIASEEGRGAAVTITLPEKAGAADSPKLARIANR